VGTTCCIEPLARMLKDPDALVNQLAEHALWSVWFRLGKEEANHHVCRGSQAIGRGEHEHAVSHFNQALRIDPAFAEAYNQRALAYYLMERFEESIADCHRTIKRMPCHFGAWAGLGHCHAHLGRFDEALSAYEKALQINPHLESLQPSINELKKRLSGE
jgi:tetratricopeptide (TPR) repeat protein